MGLQTLYELPRKILKICANLCFDAGTKIICGDYSIISQSTHRI
uniref:Uncharacterized protein n=1 Tax=Siphoviridae sp. ctn8e14 TaxID=2827936 RepID=A0A8S5T5C7_9CAUD|nr:MAG TPA: hypothetical protein [Siphoviridae sp. ctn8e14]